MTALESWLLAYLLNSLWQIPMIFAAAWLSARLVRRMSPHLEHRIWVSALVLEVLLPACHLRLVDLLQQLRALALWGWGDHPPSGQISIAIGPGAAYGNGVLRLSSELLTGIVAVYGCSLLYFACRLGWGWWKTSIMSRRAEPVKRMGAIAQSWDRYRCAFGIDTAELAMSPMVSGPVTVGIRHGRMLVPFRFLESVGEGDLDAVFAHEFAHIRRRDFTKNLAYELLSLPMAYHPLLWLTRSRVAESREVVCDAMAAAAVAGREKYARSLLRLASLLAKGTPTRTLHAIGIFDANIFERRVMNLTEKRVEIKGTRRFAVVAACVVVALATCVSALALRMEVTSQAQADSSPRLKVKPEILAGMIVSRLNPIYPPQARAEKVTGAVVLALTINKEGEPTNIQVKKSVRADVDESAVTAVQQWRWKPYLLNGNPVEVDSTVTITYSFGH